MPPKLSQQRSSQVARANSSDEEDGHQENETVSMTQAQRTLMTFSAEDVTKRVNDLVQFLLVADQKKIPIKRQDINKHVLKEMSKGFPQMIEKAKRHLSEVFGINLVELEGKQKSYLLINECDISTDKTCHLTWSPEDNAKSGLTMIVLGLILMSGNVVPESAVWSTLKKLGLELDIPDPVFKDVKKLMTQDLVRQGYLLYEKIPNSDPVQHEFKWGERAKHETPKLHVLEFVSQVYDNMDPAEWTQQFADANRSSTQAAQQS